MEKEGTGCGTPKLLALNAKMEGAARFGPCPSYLDAIPAGDTRTFLFAGCSEGTELDDDAWWYVA